MAGKDSKKSKKRIKIEENQMGAEKLQAENLLREQIENPMVRLRYAYAIDFIQARLRLINAEFDGTKPQTTDKEYVCTDQGDRKYL